MDRFFPNWAPSAANFTTHTKVTLRLTCTSKVITKEAMKEPIHAITPINQPLCSQTAKTKTPLSTIGACDPRHSSVAGD
jgi:hypothetical protein